MKKFILLLAVLIAFINVEAKEAKPKHRTSLNVRFLKLCDDVKYRQRKAHNVLLQKHIQNRYKGKKSKNGYFSQRYQNFNMRPKKHFFKF